MEGCGISRKAATGDSKNFLKKAKGMAKTWKPAAEGGEVSVKRVQGDNKICLRSEGPTSM
jgi:hypothetical protein